MLANIYCVLSQCDSKLSNRTIEWIIQTLSTNIKQIRKKSFYQTKPNWNERIRMQPWPNFEPKSSNKKNLMKRERNIISTYTDEILKQASSQPTRDGVWEKWREDTIQKKTECLWKQMNSMLYLCLQCMWEKYAVWVYIVKGKQKQNKQIRKVFKVSACLYHKMYLAQCAWKIFFNNKTE